MRQIRFLCLVQILEQRTGCNCSAVVIGDAKAFHRSSMELFLQRTAADIIVEIPVFQCIHADMKAGPKILHIDPAEQERLIADDFRRHKLRDLIHQAARLVHFRDEALAGRDICCRDTETSLHADDRHDVVVLRLIKSLRDQRRTRCDNADDFALYHALCLFRVLHLLADRNLMAVLYKTVDIPFCSVIRDTAHRSAILHAAVLSGQRKLKFFGYQGGILEEHFVEIT